MAATAEASRQRNLTPDVGIDITATHEGKERPGNLIVALVTGGERGIGGMTSVGLARQSIEVIAIHRDPTKTKRESDTLQLAGEAAEFIRLGVFDISRIGDRTRMVDEIIAEYGGVDMTINNAPAGMEGDVRGAKITDKNRGLLDHYADAVNSWAKVDLTMQLVTRTAEEDRKRAAAEGREYKPRRIKVIDQPSMWSLFYGKIKQIDPYERVAWSKYAGMMEQREAVDELNRRGHDVVFGMVCGHGIEGTITMKMLKALDGRLPPEEKFYDKLEATAIGGRFPPIETMSNAIVEMATSDFKDGEIRYVGIPHWDKERLDQEFYMYADRMKRVDDIVFLGDHAFARYTVPDDYEPNPFREETGQIETLGEDVFAAEDGKLAGRFSLMITEAHTEGHLVQADVLRGVEHTLAAVHGSKATLQSKLKEGERFRVEKIERASFKNPAVPGNKLIIVATEIADSPYSTTVTIYREKEDAPGELGDIVSEFQKITLARERDDGTADDSLAISDVIENGAQVGGLLHNKNTNYPEVRPEESKPSDGERKRKLPLFGGFKLAEFTPRRVRRGETVLTHGELTRSGSAGFISNAESYVGDEPFGKVVDILCVMRDEDRIVADINKAKPIQQAA